MILLSTAYFGNIQYFSKLLSGGAHIEAHENFQKQSYRNRCDIMTAGGVTPLSVPIEWNHNAKIPIREVRIDNSQPWQRSHWRTIRSAYASSVYFEHYQDRIAEMFERRFDYLFEMNCVITSQLLELLGRPTELLLTDSYMVECENDFRNSISHKPRLHRSDPMFVAPEYFQVFGDRLPFAPNLSILDLIFCEGPSALVHK